MAQILVRDLDDATVARLKERAARGGHSPHNEVKAILEGAARSFSMEEARQSAARIRARLKGKTFSDSTELIREDRER